MLKKVLGVIFVIVILLVAVCANQKTEEEKERIAQLQEEFKSVDTGDILEFENGSLAIVVEPILGGFLIRYIVANVDQKVYYDMLTVKVVDIYPYDGEDYCCAMKQFIDPILR